MTMDVFMDSIMGNLLEIIATLLTLVVSYYVLPFIRKDLIPWLKEKRMLSLIKTFVEAAEKLAETGAIQKADKKQTVINLLENKGIEVTLEIESFIEAAVKQLDLIANTVKDEIKEEN